MTRASSLVPGTDGWLRPGSLTAGADWSLADVVQPASDTAAANSAVVARIRLMLRRYDRGTATATQRLTRFGRQSGAWSADSGGALVKVWRGRCGSPTLGYDHSIKGDNMGVFDNAKDAAEATGKKIGDWADDTKDRIGDRVDEAKADAEVKRAEGDVKKAEANRDATETKNEYKENLRD
ncbi:hypothetical protein GCM10027413_28800 [Conyzicola nivalis]|uniref:Uncharacterized protein n=2 Tax=Conyzicola nivalis TaxID=1477021 RepID=A0A916SR74_9MICO|nr:hypothetical protein GCM10010979_30710 [Conyzicola nivalis]